MVESPIVPMVCARAMQSVAFSSQQVYQWKVTKSGATPLATVPCSHFSVKQLWLPLLSHEQS